MQVKDHRTGSKNVGFGLYYCATDRLVSGSRMVGGRSYVAYDVSGLKHAVRKRIWEWLEGRKDYMRLRENNYLPQGRKDDHLSIYDPPEELLKPRSNDGDE